MTRLLKPLVILWAGLSLIFNLDLIPSEVASFPARAANAVSEVAIQSGTGSISANLRSSHDNRRTKTANSASSLYIPLIYHDRADPDIRSPFTLQIAALSQVMPAAGPQGSNSPVSADPGASLLLLDQAAYESIAAALKNSGAGWARLRVEWEVIEPIAPVSGELPEYYWDYFDQALGIVADAGVRIIATLSDSPTWAASVPCAPIYPDRLDEYGRFLKDLVSRYKEPPYLIKHWELVNEPDSNRYTTGHLSGHGCWAYDGDQYAHMLLVAYQAIKEADPQAKVLMGGIAYDWFEEYGGPFNRYFPDDVMENGGGAYIDALNFHFYTDFSSEWDRWNPSSYERRHDWVPAPTCGLVDDGLGTSYEVEGFDVVAKTTHFRNRMQACYGVSKPVWLTEVGAHGYPEDPNSLVYQAQYVIKVYARALSAGVRNITWYSLDQPPYDHYEQALLYTDFSPKPAFFAYQTLTRELDGFFQYSHDRNQCYWSSSGPACYVEAYVFKDGYQNEKTIAWGSRSLEFKASILRLVNRDGEESIIKDGSSNDADGTVDGTIKLKLSDEPVFISTW